MNRALSSHRTFPGWTPDVSDPLAQLQRLGDQSVGGLTYAANYTSPLTTANVKYGTTGSTSSYTGTQVMQNR